MKSTTELNDLVAAHIMGWHRMHNYWYDPDNHEKHPAVDIDNWYQYEEAWNPSEKLIEAQEVIDVMYREGYSLHILAVPLYECVFYKGDSPPLSLRDSYLALPLAISLAALKAKGVPV